MITDYQQKFSEQISHHKIYEWSCLHWLITFIIYRFALQNSAWYQLFQVLYWIKFCDTIRKSVCFDNVKHECFSDVCFENQSCIFIEMVRYISNKSSVQNWKASRKQDIWHNVWTIKESTFSLQIELDLQQLSENRLFSKNLKLTSRKYNQIYRNCPMGWRKFWNLCNLCVLVLVYWWCWWWKYDLVRNVKL